MAQILTKLEQVQSQAPELGFGQLVAIHRLARDVANRESPHAAANAADRAVNGAPARKSQQPPHSHS